MHHVEPVEPFTQGVHSLLEGVFFQGQTLPLGIFLKFPEGAFLFSNHVLLRLKIACSHTEIGFFFFESGFVIFFEGFEECLNFVFVLGIQGDGFAVVGDGVFGNRCQFLVNSHS